MPVEVEEIIDDDTAEVEIFDEFWSEPAEEPEPEVPVEKAQPQTASEIKSSANEDIEDFLRSIGIDYYEKGDKQ